MTSRFKPAHPPFSLASRLMREFGSIVRILARVMNRIRYKFPVGYTITPQFIGHYLPRFASMFLQ